MQDDGPVIEGDGNDELREARPGGPPLTSRDLLAFHFLLESDDWFGRLLELEPGTPKASSDDQRRVRRTPWSRRRTQQPGKESER